MLLIYNFYRHERFIDDRMITYYSCPMFPCNFDSVDEGVISIYEDLGYDYLTLDSKPSIIDIKQVLSEHDVVVRVYEIKGVKFERVPYA